MSAHAVTFPAHASTRATIGCVAAPQMVDLTPAWDGLRQANWTAARDLFAARLEEAPDDPEALDGLGRALWWLGDPQAGIERRREAYAEYRRRGDTLAISSSSNRASQCDLE
jgi:hypothetical protein